MSGKTPSRTEEVRAYIRSRVHSPDWITEIQLELDQTEDAGRRRQLEDKLRRRREALVEYGAPRPTPLKPGTVE